MLIETLPSLMWRRSFLVTMVVALLIGSVIPTYSASIPKAGAFCKKAGVTQSYKGKVFVCKKSGKKLVWMKSKENVADGISPSPTLTPTSFDDLYQARRGISYTAWKRTSETIKASESKVGLLEVFTGPNTKPFFDDYPLAVSLVSRAFPNRGEPEKTIVIRFKYQDLAWAEQTLRQKLSPEDYDQLSRDERGNQITGRCDESSRNCHSHKAMQTTTRSGISLIIQGVSNSQDLNDPTWRARFNSGMIEAHEYFHSLQRIAGGGPSRAWFKEGSAEWVQNAAINFEDFEAYRNFMKVNCWGACYRISEAWLIEFLEPASDSFRPSKFDSWTDYSLGSYVIEILVALKGPDSIIEMNSQMAAGADFDSAFKNVYGSDWDYARPIIAKTISANMWGR